MMLITVLTHLLTLQINLLLAPVLNNTTALFLNLELHIQVTDHALRLRITALINEVERELPREIPHLLMDRFALHILR